MIRARYQCYRADRELIAWRLLAGNNRVLGVSSHRYRALEQAVAAIRHVHHAVERGEFAIERQAGGLWWWDLTARSGPLAHSPQGFARRVDARLAADRFRSNATVAEIEQGLSLFESGRRGRTLSGGRSARPELPRPRSQD
ncbi:hypothetical protein ACFY3U_25235 [Micromonospora sp. NPDC000089]|uniref:hypothetical protein n=1 Tax=unclassified Micromonospora TaxID=2617518 RepID=UPI00369AD76F